MANWYVKGQSDYETTDFHMGFWFDVNGFPEANYDSIAMPGDVAQGDPFMAVAAETKPTWNPGSQVVEIGLWDHNRIKIDTAGIWGWHNASGAWISLYGGLGGGGGSGATQLSELLDVESVVYTAGYVLRGNNSKYVSAQLAHGDLSDAPTNAHHIPTTAGDLNHNDLANINAGDSYEHITQTQKSVLHSIYTLESHNNTYHSTNYEAEFSKNTAFNKDFGTLGTEVCVGNDSRLSDSRTPTQHAMDSTTYHSRTDLTTLNASSSYHGFLKKLDNNASNFMNGQGNWAVPPGTYSLEVHNNTYHDPDYKEDFSENTAFNKNFGSTGTEVCVGNDARLSDSRTDDTAIHDDVLDEIHQITEEASPASTDVLVVESAGNSWAKRRVQITNLPGGADPDAIHVDVVDEIHQITIKDTPVGADEVVIEDSQASWAKKRVTITSLLYDVGIDGGKADSVYLPGQNFDGGSA